jgi:hypothetical protein
MIIEQYCNTDSLAEIRHAQHGSITFERRVPPQGREQSPIGVPGGAKEIPRRPFQPLAMEEAFRHTTSKGLKRKH